MLKNVSGQKVKLFAFDYSTGAPKTGDAANLTAYIAKDGGSTTALADTSATEVSSTNAPGVYEFDLSQTETNADRLDITCKSSTANVAIVPILNLQTVAQYFSAAALDSSGQVTVGALAANVITAAATASDFGAEIADAVHDEVVDGSLTFRQSTRLQNSAMFCEVTGLGSTTVTFRDYADTKDRIVATVDADGDRTSFATRDGT